VFNTMSYKNAEMDKFDRHRPLRAGHGDLRRRGEGVRRLSFDEVPRVPLFQPTSGRRHAEERQRLPLLVPSAADYRQMEEGVGAPGPAGEATAMLAMIGRRLVAALPSIAGVVVVTFLLTRLLPGDPAAYFAGPRPRARRSRDPPQARPRPAAGRRSSCLCRANWRTGDWGQSLSTGQPVATEMATRLPASLELTLVGLLFAQRVDPAGHPGRRPPGSWIDHAVPRIVDHRRRSPADLLHRPAAVLPVLFLLGWAPSPLGRSTLTSTHRTSPASI
jgi:hypothetical protein